MDCHAPPDHMHGMLDEPPLEATRSLHQLVHPRDDGVYELICPNGHQSVTILQDEKFEVLFDIGARAILDGYYREAVSSFAASLERFYEFVLTVLFSENQERIQLFRRTWKHMPRSELQLGAFLFAWAFEMGEDPKPLNEKWVSFRNRVIHRGEIPSRDRAIEYGNVVLCYMRGKIATMSDRVPDKVQAAVLQSIVTKHSLASKSGGRIATMSRGTIIGLSVARTEIHHCLTLEQHLLSIQKNIQVGLE